MYEGKNPTALQSKRWIEQALLGLMREKNFPGITVREICARADLSRQTFYNLYPSKEDVLRGFLRAQVEGACERLSRERAFRGVSLRDTVRAFAEVLLSNREELLLMTGQGLGGLVSAEIANGVSLFAGQFCGGAGDADGGLGKSYAAAFLSGGLTQTMLLWLRLGEPADAEELSALLEACCRGELYGL